MATNERIDSIINQAATDAELANLLKKLKEADDLIRGMGQIKLEYKQASSVTDMRKSTEDLVNANKKMIDTQGAIVNSQRELDKVFVQGKVSLQEYNKDLKDEIKLQNAAAGSIDEARAKMILLRKERNKLDLGTEAGQAQKKVLNDQINALDEFIEKENDIYTQRKINIGNYRGSAAIIVEALGGIESKMDSLRQKQASLQELSKSNPIGFKVGNGGDELNKVNAELAITEKQFTALKTITSDPEFFNLAAKVGEGRVEVIGFTQELNKLKAAGLGDADFAIKLKEHLAQLTDQMNSGAFSGAFKTLQDELTKVQTKINSGNFTGKDLENLRKEEALLIEVTHGVGQSFATTRAEQKAYDEASQRLGLTLGQDSTAFKAFRQEVGKGKDDIKDIKDSIKLASSDTQGFDRLIKAAQGLTGVYATATEWYRLLVEAARRQQSNKRSWLRS
jgi:hypothetical protein